MIFPTLLLGIFFLTLNFNHTVLYAPSDFRDDQAFLDALKAIVSKETEPQEPEKGDSLVQKINSDVKKVIKAFGGKYTWRTIRGISKEQSLNTEVVLESLNWLTSRGLAVKSVDKERWALTSEGRSLIENIS
jgi:ribosomal protein S19E (S16A)